MTDPRDSGARELAPRPRDLPVVQRPIVQPTPARVTRPLVAAVCPGLPAIVTRHVTR